MTKIIGGVGGLLAAFCMSAFAGDDLYFRAGGGRVGALGDNNSGSGWYGHAFAGTPGTVIGLSHSHLFLDNADGSSVATITADLKESSLLVGWGLPSAMLLMGPSRVQVDGTRCRRDYHGDDHCVAGGFAAEIDVNLLFGPAGLELRLFGNVNQADKFSGASVGISFGSHPEPPPPRPEAVIEIRPQSPVAPPPSAPAAAPAAGKTAKIRPEAQARSQPKIGTSGTIPAGATVTLKSSVNNNEGTWWYVEANGRYGWARAEDLDVAP